MHIMISHLEHPECYKTFNKAQYVHTQVCANHGVQFEKL